MILSVYRCSINPEKQSHCCHSDHELWSHSTRNLIHLKIEVPKWEEAEKTTMSGGMKRKSPSLRHSMHRDKKRVPQFTSPHNTGQTHLRESSVRDQITSTAETVSAAWKDNNRKKIYILFQKMMKRQRHAGKTRKLIFHRTDLLNQMVLPQKGKMIYLIRLIGDVSTYWLQIKKWVFPFEWLLGTTWTMLPGGA